MTDITLNSSLAEGAPIQPASRPNLDKGFNPLTMIIFFGLLLVSFFIHNHCSKFQAAKWATIHA